MTMFFDEFVANYASKQKFVSGLGVLWATQNSQCELLLVEDVRDLGARNAKEPSRIAFTMAGL
jgi:hypothetical protein